MSILEESYVYFIKPVLCDGPIKIGYSANPRSRLIWMTSWSPVALEIIIEIPGTIDLEMRLHDIFLDIHSHGEWFYATNELCDFISKLKAGVPVERAIDLTKIKGSLRSCKNYTSVRTPEHRLFLSYAFRINAIVRRFRSLNNYTLPDPLPDDISQILAAWRGTYVAGAATNKIYPTPAQFARLDQFISDSNNNSASTNSAPSHPEAAA